MRETQHDRYQQIYGASDRPSTYNKNTKPIKQQRVVSLRLPTSMELGIDRRLGVVFGSRDGFIEKMLEVQDNVTSRTHFSYWASHLRFIEVPRIDIPELDEDSEPDGQE